jgi:TetR/AcrR family fatty acid metabolism transcriptional regulator
MPASVASVRDGGFWWLRLVLWSAGRLKRGVVDRQSRREDKRQRIIDAAVEVFSAKGFFGARVAEIAEIAGVADGTIYLYFKSKDDLLISLFEERMGEINRRFAAMLATLRSPEEKLRRYLIEHLRMVAQQPKLMQVLTVELRQSTRFIREYRPLAFAKYLALLGTILEEGKRTGVFRPDMDTALFRRALFGAIDEISLEWILRGAQDTSAELERKGDQVARFVLRGLRPDAEAPDRRVEP